MSFTPSVLHQRLHENQLTIAAKHRGGLSRRPDGVEIHSGDEELRYVILEAPLAQALPEGCHSLRVMPWAGELSQQLHALGFQHRGGLLYMSLQREPPPPPHVPGYRVERALTSEALAAFTDIQLRAFPEFQDDWRRRFDFLLASQLRNVGDPSHFYLLGHTEGRPVSAGLLLHTRGVGGIYSLATLDAYRGRGRSRVLISHLIDEARRIGCDVIALQVSSGTHAERLYRRLGFEPEFEVRLYVR
ncbi:MAG TPA: GNAT family N-acetyltransferase [Archangium sp.]|jgi:GNAT superfamily N-acetyltransferase|uniref:GNAT family N-acetyltransferase n=1 Tax=Archangium sp. TaxID=1872627 RepID=UPI002EDA1BC1